ncbi:hypothetical protein MRX96_040503 [Rhipicephalus microplus]
MVGRYHDKKFLRDAEVFDFTEMSEPSCAFSPTFFYCFVIFYFNGTTRGVISYTAKLATEELLCNVMACMIVSIPVHLFLEAPFVRLREQCSHEEDEDSVCDSIYDISLQEKNAASKYS